MTTNLFRRVAALCVAALLVSGCATKGARAPVEQRNVPPSASSAATQATPAASASVVPTPPVAAADPAARPPPPGAENAGKPGYYTVKPGDTLIRIGLDSGQNWRDIARWNAIDNPNLIEVGQVLRVAPPATAQPVAAAPRVETRPLDPTRPAATSAGPVAAAASSPAVAGASAPTVAASTSPATAGSAPAAAGAAAAVAPTAPAATPAPAAAPREGDEEPGWAWPAAGPVVGGFDEVKNKGIAITGKAGDAVLAAADGRVVYAGSGLRGYGNLLIVKHNSTYLTAYAHNQALLVKEDQPVRRGQKIAEMGSSDAERVQLHFEIRRNGKPVDPVKLLPPR